MASVRFEGVSKVYRDGRANIPALTDLSIHISDGEYAVILGPSGCGKTTALRLVAGLEEPTAGQVRIADQIVNEVQPRDRDVAMVFQHFALYPHLNVRKNLAFGLTMRGAPPSEIQHRVQETAALLDIEGLLDRQPHMLSGGEKQRVALGRAVIRKPKVFLLDEPLSNLDTRLRIDLREELRRLHRTLRATFLHVTHDQEEAMALADRIFVLKSGELQQAGTPEEIYRNPANRFVAQFVGNPRLSLLRGRLETINATTHLTSTIFEAPIRLGDAMYSGDHLPRDIWIGIRPEAITVNFESATSWHCPKCDHSSAGPYCSQCGAACQAVPLCGTASGIVPQSGTRNVHWSGTVESLEFAGSSTHLRVRTTQETPLIVRIPSEKRYAVGSAVQLAAPLDALLLFEADDTGTRIVPN